MIVDGSERRKLDARHPDYADLAENWRLFFNAYRGGKGFLRDALTKHARESQPNYEKRLKAGEVFNISRVVVDTYCNFLGEIKPMRELGELTTDEIWGLFITDVDLKGLNYDRFWAHAQKLVSVFGMLGILVDRPLAETDTKQEEIDKQIYPYYTAFSPLNILDWDWRRQESGRWKLVYLKLREVDQAYLLWTETEWERWTLKDGSTTEWELTGSGENGLNEIPFVWFVNSSDLLDNQYGSSDIVDIVPIQRAITRALSGGDEVIEYAAFPMMRKPFSGTPGKVAEDDVVGVTGVLQFDPEHPDSKPDWLPAQVKEPIDAILTWIDKKVREAHRMAHLSSIFSQKTGEAKSGTALKWEFLQLHSVLSAKADATDEAELACLKYWLMWQGNDTTVKVERARTFGLEDLGTLLETVLVAKALITSETFGKKMQKKVARMIIDEETDPDLLKIDKEIEDGVSEEDPKFTDMENLKQKLLGSDESL